MGGTKGRFLCGCRGHGVTCKSFPPAEWALSDGPDTAPAGDARQPDTGPLRARRIFVRAQIHNRVYVCVCVCVANKMTFSLSWRLLRLILSAAINLAFMTAGLISCNT